MDAKEKQDKFVGYRKKVLPVQLDRARRRYIGLVREARRLQMTRLLTNEELHGEGYD